MHDKGVGANGWTIAVFCLGFFYIHVLVSCESAFRLAIHLVLTLKSVQCGPKKKKQQHASCKKDRENIIFTEEKKKAFVVLSSHKILVVRTEDGIPWLFSCEQSVNLSVLMVKESLLEWMRNSAAQRRISLHSVTPQLSLFSWSNATLRHETCDWLWYDLYIFWRN